MIRIVVTGSECTGKTTLTKALAQHFETPWVPEYSRQFVEEQGRVPGPADVEAIARGQIESEDRVATTSTARSAAVLLLDTDLLSVVVYSRHYFGDCQTWIEKALRARPADLYLLAGVDVPWVPDGEQRDRGERRQEMQDLFRCALRELGLRFEEVSGAPDVRLETARAAIRQTESFRT